METAAPPPRGPRLLERLGLHRRELRAWALYDWAQSAVITVIMTAVFPIYFVSVAGGDRPGSEATGHLAVANTVAMAIIAVLSPILGAVADFAAAKKRLLGTFLGVGAAAVACLFFVQQGELTLAAVLFVLSLVGATGSFVFYEALLPHIASREEMDRVSTAGYAVGYVGGGILLALNLAWILQPGWFGLPSGEGLTPSQQTLPVRLAFLSVAVWWVLFSLPLFWRVPEPPRLLEAGEPTSAGALRMGMRRLLDTLQELQGHRQAFLMLVAFLVYNDGIQTIVKMAAAYGTELGIGRGPLIGAILLVQFVGIPFTFLFGMLAGRIGTRRCIFLGLGAYAVIALIGFFMTTATHFFILAALVGIVQGGTQALSRSLFASMVPRHKSGEFFGFFSVFEKFAGIFGPLVFALTIQLTGHSRPAILSLILFFVVGAALLSRVNVEEGVRAARQAEREARPVGEAA